MHCALVTAGVRAFFSGSRWLTEKGVSYGVLSVARGAAGRVAYLFCIAFFLLFSSASHALLPKATTYRVNSIPWTGWYSTKEEACTSYFTLYQTTYPSVPIKNPTVTNNGASCSFYRVSDNGGIGASFASQLSCPSNSSASGSSCACNSGYYENGSQCISGDERCRNAYTWESQVNGLMSDYGATRDYRGSIANGTQSCFEFSNNGGTFGCLLEFDSFMRWTANGQTMTGGRFVAPSGSGLACSLPTTPDKVPPTPSDCPSGQMRGTVNGQSVCYTPGPKEQDRVETPRTTTTTETVDNGDGTKTTTTRTTTTQTTCTGGSCNTTTTTTTNVTTTNISTGATISSTTNTTNGGTTNPLTGFCKENPKSPLCVGDEGDDGGKSQFGGSCGGGFQCKGDAIQCAMAKEQHVRNCKAFEPQGTAEEGLYDDAKGKAGTNQSGDNSNNETIDLNTTLDTSDAIGGGTGGMSDLTVTVWKRPITLPFSIVNQYLGYLGNLLVAISFLVAFRIVTRG